MLNIPRIFVTHAGKNMPAAVVFKAGSNYRWFRDRQERKLHVGDAGISELIRRMSAHVIGVSEKLYLAISSSLYCCKFHLAG